MRHVQKYLVLFALSLKGSEMICVYDNPTTMSRECWQDGVLQYAITVAAMYYKRSFPIPARYIHMGANCLGEFKAGQYVGDLDAMKGSNDDSH